MKLTPENLNLNFIQDIREIVTTAQANAVRSVEFHRVEMYWKLGERIFVEEQQEKDRAEYGSYLVHNLSISLEKEYGSGFSKRQLERARQFYRTFPIASAVRTQLNWMQYKLLISISDESKREFYELEAVKNRWNGREMVTSRASATISSASATSASAKNKCWRSSMRPGFMYILQCADNSYYTGSTTHLELRLTQHQNGEGANHTKKRLPITLVYFEKYSRIDDAFYREKQVQGWSRKKKEALINGNVKLLPKLALAYRDKSCPMASSLREPQRPKHESKRPEITNKKIKSQSSVPEALEGMMIEKEMKKAFKGFGR